MKLGFVLGYSGADMTLPIDRVLEAERLGFDSVWSSEAYGSDAVTPAAWVLARTTRIKVGTAIMQMPARTPASIRNSAEIADGMIPVFMDPQRFELFEPHLNAGFAKTSNRRSLATYDICPFVPVSMADDIEAARLPIKQHLALYIGGMGAREKNFYNDYAKRLGYEAEAIRIQDAFLAGRKAEAVAAVPDALVDEIALVGT